MGRATAHLFAQEGASVAVTDINQSGIESVVAEIEAEGGGAHGWHLDVLDAPAIKRGVAEGAERVGRLDILINNAGLRAFRPLAEERLEGIRQRARGGRAADQEP